MSSNVSWISSLLDPYFLLDEDAGFIQGFNSSTLDREREEDAPNLTTRALIKGIVLTVMAVLSLAANSATLVSIVRRKKAGTSRSSMYTLLFQLAIADLLVSLWCLLGEAAWTYSVEWKGGNLLCKAFKFFQVFSLYLSTSTMVLIGFDRLLAIRRPINHRSCCRPIGIAWGISALLASPQLAIFRVVEGPFRQRFQQCVTYGFYTEEWQEKLYSILSLLTMFVIPLVALVACYVCIFRSIARKKERGIMKDRRRRASLKDGTPTGSPVALLRQRYREQHRYISSRRSTDSNTSGSRRDLFQKAKIKSLRISIIIISAFILCWAPYYFMMITFIFLQPDEKLGQEMQLAIFFFGMSNSLINPLIYGAFHLCGSGRWGRKWILNSSASASIGRTESARRVSSLRLRRHPTERILLNRISSANSLEYGGVTQLHNSHRRMRLIPSSSRHRRHFSLQQQQDHLSSTSGGDARQQRRPSSTYVTTYL